MYTYVRALARLKGGSGNWENVDISAMPLSVVYAKYSSIKAILTNPVISGQMTVDFDDLHESLRVLTITFPEYLVSIGNKALPVVYTVPSAETARVRTVDAWFWNFDIKPANHTKHPDAVLVHDDQTDLFVIKSTANPLELQKYCIATVNGFTHQMVSSTAGTFILGGCTSGRVANNNQVSFIDFSGIGTISISPLSRESVLNVVQDLPLTESVYVSVNTPMLGKTAFLSFAGYFFALDNAYDVVADNVMKINTRHMNLIARYYESREYLNWGDVFKQYEADRIPDRVLRDQFETDETIRAILDMEQTFIVVCDSDSIEVRYVELSDTQLPGVYLSYVTEPQVPVKVNLGRMPEYMAVLEIDQWVIKVDGYMVGQPQRELVSTHDLVIYENGFRTPKPEWYSNAKLMYIEKMLLVDQSH